MAQEIWKPRVGQLVRLTETGMETIGGIRTQEGLTAQQHGFVVIDVEEAYTTPECWAVDVAGPFSHFLLTSLDVTPAK